MKIVKASYKIETPISNMPTIKELAKGVTYTEWNHPGINELKTIEMAARNCYKSEARITEDEESAKKMVKMLIDSGHEAMLEHSFLTVRFICDRAISHELVRHRMASFAQESQRYCNYSKGQFEGHVTFVQPFWMKDGTTEWGIWKKACLDAEKAYFDLLEFGLKPEQARMVLPNCTKTEVIISANYREWRHILKLRTAPAAHPDMQNMMIGLCHELQARIPVVFDDIIGGDERT